MDSRTALALFTSLEKARQYDDPGEAGYNPPTYDVRLDAYTDRESERAFRVRVSQGEGGVSVDDWRFIFEEAHRLDIETVDVQNAGIELR
jgi:hypothetical protein